MGLPKEVLEYAIKTTTTAETAAEQIQNYERIRYSVQERNRKILALREKTEKTIAAMLKTTLCFHDVRKTHGDPSGGSDSHEECLVCGETLYAKRGVRFT